MNSVNTGCKLVDQNTHPNGGVMDPGYKGRNEIFILNN